MPKRALTIPNLLSILRILLAPLLLVAAATDLPGPFLFLFLLSLVSDALDGFLARRLNQVSELGAQLDSWAPNSTVGATLPPILPHRSGRGCFGRRLSGGSRSLSSSAWAAFSSRSCWVFANSAASPATIRGRHDSPQSFWALPPRCSWLAALLTPSASP
ncbi:MAG: CDP-alcohol phosphatidyltransferase family protein [Deltaproteobacteria bacterium]|nr:MAG: CDP-alcohol phosphatidyltransferase family protein [Deltaproteobacteria bacterium]